MLAHAVLSELDRAILELASATLLDGLVDAIGRYRIHRFAYDSDQAAAQPWLARLVGEQSQLLRERTNVGVLLAESERSHESGRGRDEAVPAPPM